MKRNAKGILPSTGWLQANGYHSLDDAMRKHPEAFAHIRQDHRRRTAEEWVSEADRLVQKRRELPNPGWLRANGYRGLERAMRKHPGSICPYSTGK